MAPLSPQEFRELDYEGITNERGGTRYRRTDRGYVAIRVHRAFLASQVIA